MEHAFYRYTTREGEARTVDLTEKLYNPKIICDRIETVTRVPEERAAPFWLREGGEATGSENMVTFRDVVVDVGSGERHRVGPGWFDTVSLNANYDRDAQCPLWLQSLQEWSGGDANWIRLLRLMFGYAILPNRDYQKWFLFYGVPRSGKGTVLHTLRNLMGPTAVLTKGLSDLVSPFGLDGVESARVLVVNEVHHLDKGDGSKASAIVKQLVGQDPINVNIKYVRPLRNVESRALPILQSNEIPTLEDRAGGLSSKMVLVPFSISFLDRENITLVRDLKREMPGIAQWALRGAEEVITDPGRGQRRFPMLQAAQDAVDDYILAVNPFNRFLDDHFEVREHAWVSFEVVWQRWLQWSRDEATVPGVTRYTFTRKLLEGTNWRLTRSRRDHGRIRGFSGMQLRYVAPAGQGEGD
jgi:putative DNA primase/helicase